MPAPLRILIVDDEALARQRLEDLLAGEPRADVVGHAASGREAVDAIRRLAPDVVFLDIQMPGLTGIDVVEEVGPEHMPMVIFVTAYDQYALKAFDLSAVDYLLKPFDDERFEQAFDRAYQRLRAEAPDALQAQLQRLLDATAGSRSAAPGPYVERIAVELRGQVRVVPVEAVDYIEADGPYARLHVGDADYLIRERMQTLEERLDPARFVRIHRSTIVRLDRIDTLYFGAGGDYALRLHDGTRLKVSRGRREELEQRLGIDQLDR